MFANPFFVVSGSDSLSGFFSIFAAQTVHCVHGLSMAPGRATEPSADLISILSDELAHPR